MQCLRYATPLHGLGAVLDVLFLTVTPHADVVSAKKKLRRGRAKRARVARTTTSTPAHQAKAVPCVTRRWPFSSRSHDVAMVGWQVGPASGGQVERDERHSRRVDGHARRHALPLHLWPVRVPPPDSPPILCRGLGRSHGSATDLAKQVLWCEGRPVYVLRALRRHPLRTLPRAEAVEQAAVRVCARRAHRMLRARTCRRMHEVWRCPVLRVQAVMHAMWST